MVDLAALQARSSGLRKTFRYVPEFPGIFSPVNGSEPKNVWPADDSTYRPVIRTSFFEGKAGSDFNVCKKQRELLRENSTRNPVPP